MDTYKKLDFQLAQAHTHQDLVAGIASYLQELGFEWFTMLCQAMEVFDHPPLVFYSTLSPEWVDEYMQNNYFGVDPIIQLGIRASENPRPLFWSVDDDWESYGEETESFMKGTIRSAGFDRGVAIPFSLQRMRGVLNLPIAIGAGWPDIDRVTKGAFALPYFLYHLMRIYKKTNISSSLNVKLTTRERTVFELIADGLTSQQIADQLHLTKRTVDGYTIEVQEKLGAENRLQALCKAVSLGLIMPTGFYRSSENILFVHYQHETP